MEKDKELLNLISKNSLVRRVFEECSEKGFINFPNFSGEKSLIPKRFIFNSLIPKKGLSLSFVSDKVTKILSPLNANQSYLRKTIPGVCEIIKNAYEHGNNRENTKKITFAYFISREKVEFLVGDEGGSLDYNFLPYVLLMRQKDHGEFYEKIPDFYSFKGDLYAPSGHSGVGTKTANFCFDFVNYYQNSPKGLLVHLEKQPPKI